MQSALEHGFKIAVSTASTDAHRTRNRLTDLLNEIEKLRTAVTARLQEEEEQWQADRLLTLLDSRESKTTCTTLFVGDDFSKSMQLYNNLVDQLKAENRKFDLIAERESTSVHHCRDLDYAHRTYNHQRPADQLRHALKQTPPNSEALELMKQNEENGSHLRIIENCLNEVRSLLQDVTCQNRRTHYHGSSTKSDCVESLGCLSTDQNFGEIQDINEQHIPRTSDKYSFSRNEQPSTLMCHSQSASLQKRTQGSVGDEIDMVQSPETKGRCTGSMKREECQFRTVGMVASTTSWGYQRCWRSPLLQHCLKQSGCHESNTAENALAVSDFSQVKVDSSNMEVNRETDTTEAASPNASFKMQLSTDRNRTPFRDCTNFL